MRTKESRFTFAAMRVIAARIENAAAEIVGFSRPSMALCLAQQHDIAAKAGVTDVEMREYIRRRRIAERATSRRSIWSLFGR